MPRAKPHADQLHLFAAKTGLPVEAIAMVGDNSHDLEMAHAAGAGLAIGVLSGNSTLDDLAHLSDAILGSIAALPARFWKSVPTRYSCQIDMMTMIWMPAAL